MFAIEQKVRGAARKAGCITAGSVLAAVGAAFLTGAAWIYLSAEFSALMAAIVIGCAYMGVGAVVLAFGTGSSESSHGESANNVKAETPAQLVLLSFLQGMEQGRQSQLSQR